MPTVTTDTEAYQDLGEIRDRVDYRGTDLFDDNEQLRFDQLLVRLERESRKIFETLWGDQTPLEETGRTDVKRTTSDSAMPLVYPIQQVTKVERKRSLADDWTEVDPDWYDATAHRLVIARTGRTSRIKRGNTAARLARRATWRDFAVKIRVTYDRGFTDLPADIASVQIQLINQMLRKLKREQTVGAASPDELAEMTDRDEVVTEEIRQRISDVTSPGLATFSI